FTEKSARARFLRTRGARFTYLRFEKSSRQNIGQERDRP
ncbi:unnamed protein product, partial [Heterotrigona itama]